MPGLVLGVVVTFVLSLIVSCPILGRRCRGIGTPFGRHARPWASIIALGTAVLSTAVGLLIAAATRDSGVIYVGIIAPTVLWLAQVPPQRDLNMQRRTRAHPLTLPFSRLYDQIGEDQHDWCEIRMAAARTEPQYIGHAAQYYWNQMTRIPDSEERDKLDRLRGSITHRINIVRLIELDTSPARIRDTLRQHPCTQNIRKYNDDDLLQLARRLQCDAESELRQFLGGVYRLGYHKTLIYPFRPEANRQPPENHPAEPVTPDL